MIQKKLKDIEVIVAEKILELKASLSLKPTFGYNESDAFDSHPLILIKDNLYYFIIIERGKKIEERSTSDYEEIIFWIFDKITSNLSFEYASKICQDENQRIFAFRKQLSLLQEIGINQRFINLLRKNYNRILRTNIL
jgi:hypothetical protein